MHQLPLLLQTLDCTCCISLFVCVFWRWRRLPGEFVAERESVIACAPRRSPRPGSPFWLAVYALRLEAGSSGIRRGGGIAQLEFIIARARGGVAWVGSEAWRDVSGRGGASGSGRFGVGRCVDGEINLGCRRAETHGRRQAVCNVQWNSESAVYVHEMVGQRRSCSSWSGSGKMTSSCGGSGTGRPIPVQIRASTIPGNGRL